MWRCAVLDFLRSGNNVSQRENQPPPNGKEANVVAGLVLNHSFGTPVMECLQML